MVGMKRECIMSDEQILKKVSYSLSHVTRNTLCIGPMPWAEFREISKFEFFSLNCHFRGNITKIIKSINFRIFTNKPFM